ncbi:hypothetical protein HDU76_001550 [Blyttiomyces sp. JEL0837]|nr:hypothetical protein HDU76_001550 [Blyttiomyces sp. JEL0837]
MSMSMSNKGLLSPHADMVSSPVLSGALFEEAGLKSSKKGNTPVDSYTSTNKINNNKTMAAAPSTTTTSITPTSSTTSAAPAMSTTNKKRSRQEDPKDATSNASPMARKYPRVIATSTTTSKQQTDSAPISPSGIPISPASSYRKSPSVETAPPPPPSSTSQQQQQSQKPPLVPAPIVTSSTPAAIPQPQKQPAQQQPQSPTKSKQSAANSQRCCSYCGTRSTPMWRHGPAGYDPLCNGCGVKWKRGRILRGCERAKPVVVPGASSKSGNKKGSSSNGKGRGQRLNSTSSSTSGIDDTAGNGPIVLPGTVTAIQTSTTATSSSSTQDRTSRRSSSKYSAGNLASFNGGYSSSTSSANLPSVKGKLNPNSPLSPPVASLPLLWPSTASEPSEVLEARKRKVSETLLKLMRGDVVIVGDGESAASATTATSNGMSMGMNIISDGIGGKMPRSLYGNVNKTNTNTNTNTSTSTTPSPNLPLQPLHLKGTQSRTAFLTVALEMMPSTGLPFVAAVLRKLAASTAAANAVGGTGVPLPLHNSGGGGFNPGDVNCGNGGFGEFVIGLEPFVVEEVEFEVDLGGLSVRDWGYLCGVLVGA